MSGDPWAFHDEPAYMDIEEPAGYDERVARGIEKPGAERAGKKRGRKAAGDDEKDAKPRIPQLPKASKPLTDVEVRRGVSNRDKSAVNLKLAGASYQEIADALDLKSAAEAKRAVERTLAATHAPEEWQTLRMLAAARAEDLFKRSLAMASADYLVLDDGERVPNTEKLRWHQQAAADLMNHVQITGAKAPTKIEITPDEARMEEIVSEMLRRSGEENIIEADVIELDVIPSTDLAIYGEDDDD